MSIWWCEHCGADETKKTITRWKYLPDDFNENTIYLCDECAGRDGFCLVCGHFVLGSGDEIVNHIKNGEPIYAGICRNCADKY